MKHTIDFDNMEMGSYVRVLQQLLGKNLLCCIVDETYEVVWSANGDDCPDAGTLLDTLLARAAAGNPVPGQLAQTLQGICPENCHILIHCLDLEYVNSDLYLVVLVPSGPGVVVIRDVQQPFSDLASCMANHFSLALENETMVQELSQRYEELNLIFQADEHVKGHLNTRKSLGHVTRDIADFLDVDATFLMLPEMGHWFFHASAANGLAEKEIRIRKRVKQQYEALKSGGQTHFFRTKVSISQEDWFIVAAPVIDSALSPMGIIGCIRNTEGREFETGDRKLMTVTARRVAKIVQSDLDPLTGLINRAGFENSLGMLLSRPSWIKNRTAVCLFNIDQFKLLEDAYGMGAGDAVLKQIAQRLKSFLRDQDVLARIRRNEFAVILSDMQSMGHSSDVFERIRRNISQNSYQFKDTLISLTVRAGIVNFTQSINTVSDIIAKAGIAVETARELGGSCVSVFKEGDPRLGEKKTRARYAAQLQTLVENKQFILFCQPIVPLQGGHMHHEILIRLQDETGEIVSPCLFLPAAEQYHKMPLIDKWVLENTCDLLKKFSPVLTDADMSWAVNLSGQSLQDESFVAYFLSFLSQVEIPAAWLTFEITETVAIRNFDRVISVIEQVRDMGFSIALDDFGSGYSSFGYLQELPISFLKIDGMFVKNLHKDTLAQVMVKSIVGIANHLNIQTIAEFVENESILDFLRHNGVDYSQGYYTGKPMPFSAILEKIQQSPQEQNPFVCD
nr:EAL domain-containing protein [uncultured Desulfobacter sp.]